MEGSRGRERGRKGEEDENERDDDGDEDHGEVQGPMLMLLMFSVVLSVGLIFLLSLPPPRLLQVSSSSSLVSPHPSLMFSL